MPRHDPIPRRQADYERAAVAWARYKRLMKWMVAVAIVVVGLSLLYLKQSGAPMPLHMVVATVAGVGLTILVGTGLMGLVFLSHRSGHDEEAARGDWHDDG
jgi:multidrug transporter EmrE-like cation transporter